MEMTASSFPPLPHHLPERLRKLIMDLDEKRASFDQSRSFKSAIAKVRSGQTLLKQPR
jgi:hypothetical protein